MKNIIIFLVIAVILIFAIRSSIKHFKGQSSCCGGNGNSKLKKKKLKGPKTAEKIIYIEGMNCEHCKQNVEQRINEINGAVAKVNLNKNMAVVSTDRPISDEILIKAVEKANFKVRDIKTTLS